MDPAAPHLNDLHLCQECLEGCVTAIARLQSEFGPAVSAFLISTGAHSTDAAEAVNSLWADLLVPAPGRPAKLSLYRGESALQSWLNAVACNSWLSRKRKEQRLQGIESVRIDAVSKLDGKEYCPAWLADSSAATADDVVLIELIREAIESAFGGCEPEDFVLLHLKHLDGLRGAEIARMFGCDEPTVSRRVGKALSHIEAQTLLHVRRSDPWLELNWPDFIELCRTATPSCFGLD